MQRARSEEHRIGMKEALREDKKAKKEADGILREMETTESRQEQERQQEIRRAEHQEMENLRLHNQERKKGMSQALDARERTEYDERHIQHREQREDLIRLLAAERDK